MAELWQVCFEEERRYANFFFNNAFRPENCLVYRVAGRPAAMLHLLPAKIVCGGKPVRIHYVFACATAPEHRSHGYMNALLAYAALVGSQREEQFSAILPASPGLYDYYAKSDYVTFFERDEYRLSAEQLREKAVVRGGRRAFTPATLNRNAQCAAAGSGRVRPLGGQRVLVCGGGQPHLWAASWCAPRDRPMRCAGGNNRMSVRLPNS